jgi:hypothetical protein
VVGLTEGEYVGCGVFVGMTVGESVGKRVGTSVFVGTGVKLGDVVIDG